MRQGQHLTGEARLHQNDVTAARLAVAYLPKGKVFVVNRDTPQFPVRFTSEKMRDSWLFTFYCGDKRILNHARRIARKLNWIS